ncbi:hypothetical protein evm_010365 [Chilo suppressalis]|nr:hypothetical protein evm_010365 [Chilo suppressalis]
MPSWTSIFSCGQAYLALSRITNLHRVHLINVDFMIIKAQASAITENNQLRRKYRTDLSEIKPPKRINKERKNEQYEKLLLLFKNQNRKKKKKKNSSATQESALRATNWWAEMLVASETGDVFALLEGGARGGRDAVEAFAAVYGAVREPWLTRALLLYHARSGSARALDLLARAPDHHARHLLDALHDRLRADPPARRHALAALAPLVARRPPWLHRLPAHPLARDLARTARREREPLPLLHALLALAALLPAAPALAAPLAADLAAALLRPAALAPPPPPPAALHLRLAQRALFHALYATHPCTLLEALRSDARERERELAPLLATVRLHPALLTGSRQREADAARWQRIEPHDVLAECRRLAVPAPALPPTPLPPAPEPAPLPAAPAAPAALAPGSGAHAARAAGSLRPGAEPWFPLGERCGADSAPHTPLPADADAAEPPEAAVEATPENTPARETRARFRFPTESGAARAIGRRAETSPAGGEAYSARLARVALERRAADSPVPFGGAPPAGAVARPEPRAGSAPGPGPEEEPASAEEEQLAEEDREVLELTASGAGPVGSWPECATPALPPRDPRADTPGLGGGLKAGPPRRPSSCPPRAASGSHSVAVQTVDVWPEPYEFLVADFYRGPLPEYDKRVEVNGEWAPEAALDAYLRDICAGKVGGGGEAVEQLAWLHAQLAHERWRRDVHAERNRRLLGRCRRARAADLHNHALRDRLRALTRERDELRLRVGWVWDREPGPGPGPEAAGSLSCARALRTCKQHALRTGSGHSPRERGRAAAALSVVWAVGPDGTGTGRRLLRALVGRARAADLHNHALRTGSGHSRERGTSSACGDCAYFLCSSIQVVGVGPRDRTGTGTRRLLGAVGALRACGPAQPTRWGTGLRRTQRASGRAAACADELRRGECGVGVGPADRDRDRRPEDAARALSSARALRTCPQPRAAGPAPGNYHARAGRSCGSVSVGVVWDRTGTGTWDRRLLGACRRLARLRPHNHALRDRLPATHARADEAAAAVQCGCGCGTGDLGPGPGTGGCWALSTCTPRAARDRLRLATSPRERDELRCVSVGVGPYRRPDRDRRPEAAGALVDRTTTPLRTGFRGTHRAERRRSCGCCECGCGTGHGTGPRGCSGASRCAPLRPAQTDAPGPAPGTHARAGRAAGCGDVVCGVGRTGNRTGTGGCWRLLVAAPRSARTLHIPRRCRDRLRALTREGTSCGCRVSWCGPRTGPAGPRTEAAWGACRRGASAADLQQPTRCEYRLGHSLRERDELRAAVSVGVGGGTGTGTAGPEAAGGCRRARAADLHNHARCGIRLRALTRERTSCGCGVVWVVGTGRGPATGTGTGRLLGRCSRARALRTCTTTRCSGPAPALTRERTSCGCGEWWVWVWDRDRDLAGTGGCWGAVARARAADLHNHALRDRLRALTRERDELRLRGRAAAAVSVGVGVGPGRDRDRDRRLLGRCRRARAATAQPRAAGPAPGTHARAGRAAAAVSVGVGGTGTGPGPGPEAAGRRCRPAQPRAAGPAPGTHCASGTSCGCGEVWCGVEGPGPGPRTEAAGALSGARALRTCTTTRCGTGLPGTHARAGRAAAAVSVGGSGGCGPGPGPGRTALGRACRWGGARWRTCTTTRCGTGSGHSRASGTSCGCGECGCGVWEPGPETGTGTGGCWGAVGRARAGTCTKPRACGRLRTHARERDRARLRSLPGALVCLKLLAVFVALAALPRAAADWQSSVGYALRLT